jgi:hypothetical protein
MGYSNKHGKRPMEYASKASHSHLINDPEIQEFLKKCTFPSAPADATTLADLSIAVNQLKDNPIQHIIAIDGSFTEVVARRDFPSAEVAVFQLGGLIFSVEDLESLEREPFIAPEQISKLKKLERWKFCIPIKNVISSGSSLTESVRCELFQFFMRKMEDSPSLADTLKWLIFEEYREPGHKTEWNLASCPSCDESSIKLQADHFKNFKTCCSNCNSPIYITDLFRLHEVIDDDLGAAGILGYLVTTIEQIILAHLIRLILSKKPGLLSKILFIKDGPLAFFGQTANIRKPFRALLTFLFDKHDLHLVGLEKSGAFVDHAAEIAQKIKPGTAVLLSNEYIYKYIIPGNADLNNPYGRTTYYSNKVIFRTEGGSIYVASLPTKEVLVAPKETDFQNFHTILGNVEKLRCDMYDSALLPIALVNKLVSLSAHPSGRILERFVKNTVG